MIFQYTLIESSGNNKPILTVGLFSKDGKEGISTSLIVDSGADMTLIDSRLASLLGIDLLKCTKGKTVWGFGSKKNNIITYQAEIKIEFTDGKNKSRRILSDVAFIDIEDGYGVLGQKGFFEYHKISFDRKKNKFYIDEE